MKHQAAPLPSLDADARTQASNAPLSVTRNQSKEMVMDAVSPDQTVPAPRLLANALRFLAVDAVEQAKSGHPGMPMGMADIAAVLFTQFLRFDPLAPDWPD